MPNTRQRGFTLVTWLFFIAVILFLALIAMKLFPVYMEGFSVKSSVNSLASDPAAGEGSAMDLRTMLMRRLDINDVESVTDKEIRITRESGYYIVTVEYERQQHFLANIDFLVTFSYESKVKTR